MSYKKQICQLIIEKMEWWRGAAWAEHIDTRTKDEVITVMQNVVDGVANYRQKLPSAQPETPPYVEEIETEYKKWANVPCINKPLAKALYEVWKKHNREDTNRNG